MREEQVEIRRSTIGQFEDGLGVFAAKSFKKGDVVIQWNLRVLSEDAFAALSEYERQNFCHRREGSIYFYPDPERHVNRSEDPNVVPDFSLNANIALRDIDRGEELAIPLYISEDF